MTDEVRAIFNSLLCDHCSSYEDVRCRMIADEGYDVFRDRQQEAFRLLFSSDDDQLVENSKEFLAQCPHNSEWSQS